MRYLGGKSRIAPQIASSILASSNKKVAWEPFYGGLSITAELVRNGYRVIASDVHPALICLHQALKNGWLPPTLVTEQDYKLAKLLPDTDPRKAFIGFGCSFSGQYFGGYARGIGRNFAQETARNLLNIDLRLVHFSCKNFMAIIPKYFNGIIYCDPPYSGTKGYSGVAKFDHASFWTRCLEWRNNGVPIYVSEFTCPIPHKILYSVDRKIQVGRTKLSKRDCLFEIVL